MTASYIYRSRHGIYYFRLRIPLALLPVAQNRTEIRQSLHTGFRRHALKLARQLWYEYQKQFRELEEDMGKKSEGEGNFSIGIVTKLSSGDMVFDYGGDVEKEAQALRLHEASQARQLLELKREFPEYSIDELRSMLFGSSPTTQAASTPAAAPLQQNENNCPGCRRHYR